MKRGILAVALALTAGSAAATGLTGFAFSGVRLDHPQQWAFLQFVVGSVPPTILGPDEFEFTDIVGGYIAFPAEHRGFGFSSGYIHVLDAPSPSDPDTVMIHAVAPEHGTVDLTLVSDDLIHGRGVPQLQFPPDRVYTQASFTATLDNVTYHGLVGPQASFGMPEPRTLWLALAAVALLIGRVVARRKR